MNITKYGFLDIFYGDVLFRSIKSLLIHIGLFLGPRLLISGVHAGKDFYRISDSGEWMTISSPTSSLKETKNLLSNIQITNIPAYISPSPNFD
jgi:hypothetical protein